MFYYIKSRVELLNCIGKVDQSCTSNPVYSSYFEKTTAAAWRENKHTVSTKRHFDTGR